MLLRKPRSLMKPKEMKWSMLWDLSVHNTSLPFDHTCCLHKSDLETCLRFPVSRTRSRKLQSELFFLFPLPPTVQFDVVHQHINLRHKQHTNSCKQQVLNLYVLVSCFSLLVGFFGFILTLEISASKGSSSSSFPISTSARDSNWFDVITNRCYFSIQSFPWSYERSLSAILVSRLLSIVHTVGLCGFHFTVQVEIENVVFEIDWNELVLSMLVH